MIDGHILFSVCLTSFQSIDNSWSEVTAIKSSDLSSLPCSLTISFFIPLMPPTSYSCTQELHIRSYPSFPFSFPSRFLTSQTPSHESFTPIMLASHPYYSTIHISICNSGIDSGSVSKSIGLQSFESHSLITQPPRCDVVLVLVALSVLCVSGVDVVHGANAPAPSRKLPMSPYPTSIPPAKTLESASPAKSPEPASPGESPASPPAASPA